MARIPKWGQELKRRIETGEGYQYKNEGKKATWRADYLKDLPIKQYGRSYDDKLETFVKSMGGDEVEARRFRTWMNQRESGELQKNIDYQSRLKQIEQQAEDNRINQEQFKNLTTQLTSVRGEPVGNHRTLLEQYRGASQENRDGLLGFLDRYLVPISQGAKDFIAPGLTEQEAELQMQRKGQLNPITQAALQDRGLETDILKGTGYLAGAVAPVGQGYKVANRLFNGTKLATSTGAKRLGYEAVRGSTAAGLAGMGQSLANESFNPEAMDLEDYAKRTGIEMLLGGVGDPAAHLIGRGISQGALNLASRRATGDVPNFTGSPSQNVIERLPIRQAETPSQTISNDLYDSLMDVTRPRNVEMPKRQAQPIAENIDPEFENAVEEQFNYLKDSLRNRRGVQQGGIIRDDMGEVVDRYGRISENPGWYQEFYRVNGRQPTNQDLRELAERHVREGFTDEFGELPPYEAMRASDNPQVIEIDEQINELEDLLRADPSQEPAIRPVIEALELEKQSVLSPAKPKQAREPVENIDAIKDSGVPMKRLKPDEKPKEPFKPVDVPDAKEIVKRQISTEGTKDRKKWSFDHFMTATVDDLRPIHKATKDLGDKDLTFDKDPYKQARNARGVAGKAESYIYGGTFDESGKKVGKSLEEIVKPVEKNMDDFLVYLASKRAIDYDEKGLIAGIKPKDVENISDRQLAEAAIKQLEKEYPHFKDAQKAFVEYNQRILKEVADSGFYTKEQLEEIIKANENYVPMNRVQDPKVRGFEPIYPKNRYASLSNPINKRTGSEKPIINPIESAVKNTYMLTNIAERNKVGRSLLDLIEQSPDNMWGRIVGKQKGNADELGKALKEGADQLDDGKMDAVDDLFSGKGNKVYVYRNGEKVEMELQEDLYKAMLSLDAQKQNFFIKMLSVPTKTLRAGAVLSPDFGPVNIFRDQFSAFVNSKYGFVPFVDMFRGLSNVIKKDSVYWQWKKSGGANSILSTLDREYLQKDLRKMIKEPVGKRIKRNFKKGNKRELPMKALNLALEPLRTVSSITEEATRLGEFKKGLKKGASPEEAAYASRDLIDFNRAGYLGRQYNQVTAFFNAAVQSIDKTARVFKENPVGATIRATSLITLPSIVAYAYNHDKEWYKEIPQKDRDLYWHFEVGDQIYRLPKPFEVGVMFGTTAERFYEWLQTHDKEAFDGYVKTVKDTFTPPWLPTAVTPWMEVWGNKSTHFDSPIVPRREQELNPEDQFGPYQSEISKAAGNLTKTSPRNIEHVFKGYTGGLGRYALNMTDSIAKVAGSNRPELPDRGLADLPIINRFVVKNLEGNNQSVDDFYKTLDKIKRDRNSAKKNDTTYNDDLYKSMNKLSREISELQSEKRDIISDEIMSGKTKADRIRELDKMITNLAREGVNESKR